MTAEREPSFEDRVVQAIDRQDAEVIPHMARFLSPISGQKDVKGADERMLFWEADPTVDVTLLREGHATPEQLQTLSQRDPRMTPEQIAATGGRLTEQQIGLLKFPHRGRLMISGGRADDVKAQVDYVNKMVKAGPPETHPDDPFAEVAQQIQEQPPAPALPDAAPQPMLGIASLGQMGG